MINYYKVKSATLLTLLGIILILVLCLFKYQYHPITNEIAPSKVPEQISNASQNIQDISDAQSYFCEINDKLLGFSDKNRLVMVSLCERRIVLEIPYRDTIDWYVGREGILTVAKTISEISVAVPTQEQLAPGEVFNNIKYSYTQIQYWSFKTKNWTQINIPKLLDTPTRYEQLRFHVSIDNDAFVATISLYDTTSAEYYMRLNGSVPKSYRYAILNPKTGTYSVYPLHLAADAINTFESKARDNTFEEYHCIYHALQAKKIYAVTCGEGTAFSGPINEYNFSTGIVKTTTFETDPTNISDGYYAAIPAFSNYFYYFSQSSRDNSPTHLYAFEKGFDNPIVDTTLTDIKFPAIQYFSNTLGLIKDDTGWQIYFPQQQNNQDSSSPQRYLCKLTLSGNNTPMPISVIEDFSSCTDNSLVYHPHGHQDTIVYMNASNTLKVTIPDLNTLDKSKDEYNTTTRLNWCY